MGTSEHPTIRPEPVLVDAHVHFHSCFDRDRFLEAAHQNFFNAARARSLPERPLGFLLLTEMGGRPFFEALQQGPSTTPGSSWSLDSTAESESVIGSRDGEPRLIIVSGRQLATCDGLEVLALCCSQALDDGCGILETIEAVGAAAGLPTIPWGFGKWSMERGRILADLLDQKEPSEIYLGDTRARWRHAPEPREFRRALRKGIRVLPGTDPFPYPNEVTKPGSYGFLTRISLDLASPASSLRRALQQPETVPETFGERVGLLEFVKNQIGMQIKKWMRARQN